MEKNLWRYLKRAQIVLAILIAIKGLLPTGPCPDFLSAPGFVATDEYPMHLRIAGQTQTNGYFPTATKTTVNAVN